MSFPFAQAYSNQTVNVNPRRCPLCQAMAASFASLVKPEQPGAEAVQRGPQSGGRSRGWVREAVCWYYSCHLHREYDYTLPAPSPPSPQPWQQRPRRRLYCCRSTHATTISCCCCNCYKNCCFFSSASSSFVTRLLLTTTATDTATAATTYCYYHYCCYFCHKPPAPVCLYSSKCKPFSLAFLPL